MRFKAIFGSLKSWLKIDLMRKEFIEYYEVKILLSKVIKSKPTSKSEGNESDKLELLDD